MILKVPRPEQMTSRQTQILLKKASRWIVQRRSARTETASSALTAGRRRRPPSTRPGGWGEETTGADRADRAEGGRRHVSGRLPTTREMREFNLGISRNSIYRVSKCNFCFCKLPIMLSSIGISNFLPINWNTEISFIEDVLCRPL